MPPVNNKCQSLSTAWIFCGNAGRTLIRGLGFAPLPDPFSTAKELAGVSITSSDACLSPAFNRPCDEGLLSEVGLPMAHFVRTTVPKEAASFAASTSFFVVGLDAQVLRRETNSFTSPQLPLTIMSLHFEV
ncbi:unnamed protein product [Protopolystoma xenopodis]|uniref:Uncharacterized protein n=1 Tax=Protopolystoma xenopodis TaxID=117903 RepID=A0A3S5CHE2_9PLAT|nr:unnamed protein product [Protopolystoma xenopodis]